VHANTDATLEVLADSSGLTVTVLDGLPGPILGPAAVDGAEFNEERGRGLLLVAQLTQRWGSRQTGRGKTIWAEQTLPPV